MTVACICGKEFKKDSDLRQHSEAMDHGVKCLCGKYFTSLEDRRQHAQAKGCYPTCLCGKSFDSLDALRAHARAKQHHAMCACRHIFPDVETLRVHQRKTPGHKGFVTLEDTRTASQPQKTASPTNLRTSRRLKAKAGKPAAIKTVAQSAPQQLPASTDTSSAKMPCPVCSNTFAGPVGVISHIRAKHEGQEMSLQTAQAIVISSLDCLPESAVVALERAANHTPLLEDDSSEAPTITNQAPLVDDHSSETSLLTDSTPPDSIECKLCKSRMLFESMAHLDEHIHEYHLVPRWNTANEPYDFRWDDESEDTDHKDDSSSGEDDTDYEGKDTMLAAMAKLTI